MEFSDGVRRLVLQAAGTGLSGGLRSWPPLGMVALTYHLPPADSGWKRWPILRSPWGRRALIALSAAEVVADKWPGTIPRTRITPQPTHIDSGLVGRTVLDMVAGAALGSEHRVKNATLVGAAVAGVAAVVGNVLGQRVREKVVGSTKLPDPTVGAIEDVVAGLLLVVVARSRGLQLARNDRPPRARG